MRLTVSYRSKQYRREARRQRRSDSFSAGTWIAGALLILLGVMFLLNNTGDFKIPFTNWWALFILIPAVSAFGNALRAYRRNGGWTAAASGSLMAGIILILITAGFLVENNWTYFGPGLIIFAGLGILLNSLFRRKE